MTPEYIFLISGSSMGIIRYISGFSAEQKIDQTSFYEDYFIRNATWRMDSKEVKKLIVQFRWL